MRRRQLKSARLIILLIISAAALIFIGHVLVVIYKMRLADERLMLARNTLLNTIQKYQYLPSVLSKDVRLQFAIRRDESSLLLNQLMKQYQEVSGIDVIYVMNNKGRVVASSNYDKPYSFVGNNYSFRSYFRDAIEYGQGLFFGVGITSNIPGIFISARMKSPDGFEGFDAFDGVLVAKIESGSLEKLWSGIENDFLLLDGKDTILLGSYDEWQYDALATLSPRDIAQINEQKQFASKIPSNILQREYMLNFAGLALWQIMGDWYIASRHPFFDRDSAAALNKNWKIVSVRRYQDSLPPTLYLAMLISMLLYSLYLIARHRQIMNYARGLKRNYEIRRQRELRMIINNTGVGLLTIDRSGLIQSLNPAFLSLCACHRRDVLANKIGAFLAWHEKTKNTPVFGGFTETVLHTPAGNHLPVMFSVSDINIDNSSQLVTIIDISKRKQAEKQLLRLNARLEKMVERRTAELKQAQQELIRQEKMAVLGRMASAIVHELSQPLTALKTALGSLQIRYQRRDWEGLGKSVSNLLPLPEKMYEIVTQLRLFAYQGVSDSETINVNAYIRKYIAALDARGAAVHLNISGARGHIAMNPMQLDIVLNNLVHNALDAVAQAKRPEIGIATRVQDGRITISVIDNGNGLDTETAGHIFEPFFTTKVIGKGLGLGLAIARNIIKEYGGEISVRQSEGKTRFDVVLPCAELATEAMTPAGSIAE